MKFFLSKTARNAEDFRKHINKILNAQRDTLSPEAVDKVQASIDKVASAIKGPATEEEIKVRSEELSDVAGKWLKPYPNAGIRENIEVFLVALGVAMAIRTFFVQPFKIPTGSMQPTLFGVTAENLRGKPGAHPPGVLSQLYDEAVLGISYNYQEAEEDGVIESAVPSQFLISWIPTVDVSVRYISGLKTYRFWVSTDSHFVERCGLYKNQPVKKGEAFVNFKSIAGDHLFVDRVSYNFRHPERGEIVVFETRDIGNIYAHLPPDQFYIKRMVAMGGEAVRIGNDRHLVIDGKRLDNTTPHFEKVYTFLPNTKATDSHYSGHLNGVQAAESDLGQYNIAPLFPDESTTYKIPEDHYMVMGDNTANSFDSRAWGEFSRTNVIGKYFLVYWPFSSRFGWSIK